ncbi:MAG: hypothetical protein D6785_12275, partial [Planctomycetota bacterium]
LSSSGIHQPFFEFLCEKEYLSWEIIPRLNLQIEGFQILSFLGQGNTATVYKVKELKTGKIYALKMIRQERGQEDRSVERFKRELTTLMKLRHPNIVEGIGFGEFEKVPYFIMEYVQGRSLKEILKEKGKLEPAQALNYVEEVAKGLEYIEEQGLVHRDIKPENIMVLDDGRVKICDLGLAKWVKGENVMKTLTRAGAIVGTPYYVSPELLRGEKKPDIRCDIYSLGATLHHLVVGRPPFEGPSAAVVFNLHLLKPLPPFEEYQNILSRPLYHLIRKMLEKEKEKRIPSAKALLKEIHKVKENPKGITSKKRPHLDMSVSKIHSKSTTLSPLSIGIGGAILSLALFLGGYLLFSSPTPPSNSSTVHNPSSHSSQASFSPAPTTSPLARKVRKIMDQKAMSTKKKWRRWKNLHAFLQKNSSYSKEDWYQKALKTAKEWEKDKSLQPLFEVLSLLEKRKEYSEHPSLKTWEYYLTLKKKTKEILRKPQKLPKEILSECKNSLAQLEKNPIVQANKGLQKRIEESAQAFKKRSKPPGRILAELQEGWKMFSKNPIHPSLKHQKENLERQIKNSVPFVFITCIKYIRNFFRTSKQKQQEARHYLVHHSIVAVRAISRFLLENRNNPFLVFRYQRLLKTFPLPIIYFEKIQEILGPSMADEQGYMKDPFVIYNPPKKEFWMFYVTGKTTFWGGKIALAVSPDGIKWKKKGILFEVPTWIPNQKGNGWKKFLSFQQPVVFYDSTSNPPFNLFVQVNWSDTWGRYFLRYTSKDGLHWKTEKSSEYLPFPTQKRLERPFLNSHTNHIYSIWAIEDGRYLRRFFLRGNQWILARSITPKDMVCKYPYVAQPWGGVAIMLLYFSQRKQDYIYRILSRPGFLWGRGTISIGQKEKIREISIPHCFIMDPLTQKYLRVYYSYKNKIYTAILIERPRKPQPK